MLKISFIHSFAKNRNDGKLPFRKYLNTNQEQTKYGIFTAQTFTTDIAFRLKCTVRDGMTHNAIKIIILGINVKKLTIAEYCIAYKIDVTIFKIILVITPIKTRLTHSVKNPLDITVSSTLNILFQFNLVT